MREYPVQIRKYIHKITLHYRLKYSVAKGSGAGDMRAALKLTDTLRHKDKVSHKNTELIP